MNEVEVHPGPSPNGTSVQDIAALGALLTSAGLTRLQVQSLMARIRSVAEQVAMVSLNDTLEEIRRIQESRMLRIMQIVQSLPANLGYVRRDAVLMAINTVMTETPRQ